MIFRFLNKLKRSHKQKNFIVRYHSQINANSVLTFVNFFFLLVNQIFSDKTQLHFKNNYNSKAV